MGVALAKQKGESIHTGATYRPSVTPVVTLGRAMNGLCHLAVLPHGEVGFVLGPDETDQSSLDELLEPPVDHQIGACPEREE